MADEDKARGLSPYDFKRLLIALLSNADIPGVKLLGKKSDNTFENIKSDDDGRLQVYDPKVGSLISYSGTTTADGAADGSTLLDSVLTTKPDFNGNLVIITSGDYEGQARDINGITTGGTVTPLSAFGGQIVSGVTFVVVGIRTTPAEVAAIEAKLDGASGLAAIKAVVDAILVDTATTLEAKLDAIAIVVAAILVDTGTTLEGKLDHGTYGLAALKALLDALIADVGDASASTLGSLLAILGDPATAISSLIGTAVDNADLGTLFGRHLRAYLSSHSHALLIVNDASSLNANLDTALRDFLLDIGFMVTVCDHDDVAANLELSAFDVIVVSASVVTADAGDLATLRTIEVPIVCHSAEIAVSAALYLGGTAATKAAQTQIEITDNSVMWLIGQATGNLTVTASATIYTMATKTTAAVTLAEEADGTNLLTIVKLVQGEEDGGTPAYAPFFDRYFLGVADYTNMNAAFKAMLGNLYMHCVMERRFSEEAVVQVKRSYQEDIPDTDVSDTATTTESQCILLDIGPGHNMRYCLRDLRVKAQADPGANTMTVKLYEYFEGGLTNVDSFAIDTDNWGTYHSLMDMFGIPEVHSDAIRVACVMDAGTVAVKATYSYAEARR